jgi:Secretion system C-terminal sorting domain
MKQLKYLSLGLAFLGFISNSVAQSIVFNGGTLTIQSGATITSPGDLTISGTGTLTNDGTIIVKGNLTNDLPMPSANLGTLQLDGATKQTISGLQPIFVKNVVFNNAAGFDLNKSLKADGLVNFTAGVVNAPTTTEPFVFTASATVGTVGATNHVNGFVVKEGTGSFDFPVGDATNYQKISTNLSANSAGMKAKYLTGTIPAITYTTPLTKVNTSEYWTLSPIGTASGSVTMHWDATNNGGISDAVVNRRVAHQLNNTGNWIDDGAASTTGDATTGSVTSNAISSWSPFTMGSNLVSNPLPITLISFSAKHNGAFNELNWETSTEINASHFEVERSVSASNFVNIGSVKANNLNKEIKSKYLFDDFQPMLGLNYYRLKLVDLDAKSSFSKIISLSNGSEKSAVGDFYPNPAKDGKVNIEINATESGEWSISNYDLSGRLISIEKRKLDKGTNKISLENVQNGETIYNFNSNTGVSETRKLIK